MSGYAGDGPWNARFDHIALVTPKRAESRRMFERILGVDLLRDDPEDGGDPRATILNLNGTKLALLEPADPDGVTGRFLARRGPSIHHLAWRLDRVDEALDQLAAKGTRVLPDGRGGGFLHPKDNRGVLFWLRPGDGWSPPPGNRSIARVHHTTIAQFDRLGTIEQFRSLLGGQVAEAGDFGHMYGQELNMPGPQLGFISPKTPDSFVRKFLDTRGPGLHHVALFVDDMPAAVQAARDYGLRLLESRPPRTIDDDIFLHPSNPTGTLIRFLKTREERFVPDKLAPPGE